MFIIAAWTLQVATWWLQDTLVPSTQIELEHLGSPATVKPGATLRVDFTAYRFRTCTLDIWRFIERADQVPVLGYPKYQVQFVVKAVEKTPHPVTDHYTVQIPSMTPPGQYEIFSKIQYFCNGLDYMRSRYLTTRPLFFTVASQ
jgi:cytochrome c oxidase assembly protein Cox11